MAININGNIKPLIHNLDNYCNGSIIPFICNQDSHYNGSIIPLIHNQDSQYNGSIKPLIHNQDSHYNGSIKPLIHNQDSQYNGTIKPLIHNQDSHYNRSIIPLIHNQDSQYNGSIKPLIHNQDSQYNGSIKPLIHNQDSQYNGSIKPLIHNQDSQYNGSINPLIHNQNNDSNESIKPLIHNQDNHCNEISKLHKQNQDIKEETDCTENEPVGIWQYTPLIMSFAAFVVSIISIALAITYSTQSSTQSNETLNTVEITNLSCIDCRKFQSDEHQYYLNQLTRYSDECCAQNLSQLSALIALNLTLIFDDFEELPPVVNPDNFSMSGASMHRKLIASTFPEPDKEYPIFDPLQSYNLKFATDENTPLLEHNRNIELLATGTKIRESGMYLVYCSVHFKPDSPEPCKTFDEKIFRVNITKTNSEPRPEPNVLLSASHTCCDDCIRNQETQFTSGVFQLKENDFLKVDVSAEGLVSYKPQSTFFGLAMLSKTD